MPHFFYLKAGYMSKKNKIRITDCWTLSSKNYNEREDRVHSQQRTGRCKSFGKCPVADSVCCYHRRKEKWRCPISWSAVIKYKTWNSLLRVWSKGRKNSFVACGCLGYASLFFIMPTTICGDALESYVLAWVMRCAVSWRDIGYLNAFFGAMFGAHTAPYTQDSRNTGA